MNLERVKQILKKVNALIENLEDQGQTSAIERDLLLRYLRDLYEDVSQPKVTSKAGSIESEFIVSAIDSAKKSVGDLKSQATQEQVSLQNERQLSAVKKDITSPATVNVEQNQTTFYDAAASSESTVEKPTEPAQPIAPPKEAVINTFENPVQYFPPIDDHESPTSSPVNVGIKSPVAQGTGEKSSQEQLSESGTATLEASSGRFDALFAEKSATDLADKYQLQRVVTIEGAMGINERMLMINELFAGDHNVFMETVAYINDLTDFESARKYLIDGAAVRFEWDQSEKMPMASDFVQLVRRKFA